MYLKSFNFSLLAPTTAGDHVRSLNRFERFGQIGDKDNLFRNLYFYCQKQGKNVFDYVPLTFSFRLNEKEFQADLQQFARYFRSIEEGTSAESVQTVSPGTYYSFDFKYKVPESSLQSGRKFQNADVNAIPKDEIFYSGKNLWILKPSSLNRGKGLELFTSLAELNEFLKMYTTGYDVKEYIKMDYSDQDTVSPSMIKSSSSGSLYPSIGNVC